jgi:hypothetical protein
MRSWCYFTIIKIYGETAIINGNMTSIPANQKQEYLSKDVMIDTLINQLLPYVYPDTGRFAELQFGSVVNTKTLIGELYLEKNDCKNAAIYLKRSIESYNNTRYKVDLLYQGIKNWKLLFDDAVNRSNENICVIEFNYPEGQINPLTQWMLPTDKYMIKPTKFIVDLYKSQVADLGLLGDTVRGNGITYDAVSKNSSEYYINKYSIAKSQPYSSDIIISRVGDIHLLLAEALNRSGDHVNALEILNKGFQRAAVVPPSYSRWASNVGIRGRVLLKSREIPVGTVDSTEIIEDFIMEERAMELAYEGKRWFDLMRVANRRNNPAYLANKVAAKFADPSKAEIVKNRLMDKSTWLLKLPKQ